MIFIIFGAQQYFFTRLLLEQFLRLDAGEITLKYRMIFQHPSECPKICHFYYIGGKNNLYQLCRADARKLLALNRLSQKYFHLPNQVLTAMSFAHNKLY